MTRSKEVKGQREEDRVGELLDCVRGGIAGLRGYSKMKRAELEYQIIAEHEDSGKFAKLRPFHLGVAPEPGDLPAHKVPQLANAVLLQMLFHFLMTC